MDNKRKLTREQWYAMQMSGQCSKSMKRLFAELDRIETHRRTEKEEDYSCDSTQLDLLEQSDPGIRHYIHQITRTP
jgi:hypothetical protein